MLYVNLKSKLGEVSWLFNRKCSSFNLCFVSDWIQCISSGILVNGQTIGDKKVAPDGKINSYFGRFGIIHKTLGVRLEVTTEDISVLQDGKRVKLQWSDTAALKGRK